MVWADSTQVGCGIARIDRLDNGQTWRSYYIACQYTPAGNYGGQYVANVRPLTGDAEVPTGAGQLEPPTGRDTLELLDIKVGVLFPRHENMISFSKE